MKYANKACESLVRNSIWSSFWRLGVHCVTSLSNFSLKRLVVGVVQKWLVDSSISYTHVVSVISLVLNISSSYTLTPLAMDVLYTSGSKNFRLPGSAADPTTCHLCLIDTSSVIFLRQSISPHSTKPT